MHRNESFIIIKASIRMHFYHTPILEPFWKSKFTHFHWRFLKYVKECLYFVPILLGNSFPERLSMSINYMYWKRMGRIGTLSKIMNQSFPCSFPWVAIAHRKQTSCTCTDIGHYDRLFQGHNHIILSHSNFRFAPCVLSFSLFPSSSSPPTHFLKTTSTQRGTLCL